MTINSKTTKAQLLDYIKGLEVLNEELRVTNMGLVDCADELETRVFNLTCYLEYVKAANPQLWKVMRKAFSGLPGFVSNKATKKKASEKAEK